MTQTIELKPGDLVHIIGGNARVLILCQDNGLYLENEHVQEPDTMLLTENGWMIDEVLPKNTKEVYSLIREKRLGTNKPK